MSNLICSILNNNPREILYVYPDVKVSQCIDLMTKNKIGALVVKDENNFLGILSERDIVWGLQKKGAELLDAPASAVLHADVAVLKKTDTIETAMAVITETKKRHVLIAEEGKFIAIVSIGDILYCLLENKTKEIQQLQDYIQQ